MPAFTGRMDRVLNTDFGDQSKYMKGMILTSEGCSFGWMSTNGPYPVYYFGGDTTGLTATFNGTAGRDGYNERAVSDTVEASTLASKTDFIYSLQACKTWFVDVESKLTSSKFDLMVTGVSNWWDEKEPTYYFGGIATWGGRMDPGSVDSGVFTTFGDIALYGQSLSGVDNHVENTVINDFLTAFNWSNSNGTPYGYLIYSSIQKAIEDEFITDPDIIDMMNDMEWYEITETRANWVINVDGTKNPDLTITWNSPGIENGDYDSGSAVVNMEVYNYGHGAITGQWFNYGTFPYNKKVIKTTWAKMAEYAEVPDFHKLLSNIFLIDANVKLRFHLTYYKDGQMFETSLAQATITYQASTEGHIEPPRDGSTITFTHTSTDEFMTEFVDDIEIPDTPDGTSASSKQQTYSGIGVMTRTYVMSVARLQQLGRFLWSYDFYDFIQDLNASPIENIVSIKMLPFTIAGGTDEEIVLGNVGTGVLGKPVDIDYNCKQVINSSGTTIAKKYGANENFLNSKPFTKLSLFLPYIGFKELDPDIFLDKSLKVEYISDIITGSCVAVIYADSVPICQYSGLIGLDVPISATNRAQVEAGIISGVGQTIMGLSSGSLGAGAMGAMSIMGNSYHTETRGTASPSCDSFITHDVFYILENAEVQYPSRYNHIHGRPLNLSKTLRNVSGFTICENVDVSGIQGATKQELDYIKDMLEKGVYL